TRLYPPPRTASPPCLLLVFPPPPSPPLLFPSCLPAAANISSLAPSYSPPQLLPAPLLPRPTHLHIIGTDQPVTPMPSSPPEAQQASFKSQLPTPRLSPQSVPSGPPSDRRHPESESMSVAFVKGPKRKRLSKACDACHKSKRRCDGTAPCANCYYASKNCTYTDAAGRPVPAPRNPNPERPITAAITTISPASEPLPWAEQATADAPPSAPQNGIERDPTSKRSRRGQPGGGSSPPSGSKTECSPERGNSALLDPATTHELVNIFFAHCNPQRMILHKPSFSAALSLNKVPLHLVLTVCA
ncbi:hypothetical protein C2E23DRAFT_521339, partial [Lenzites betulinus]